MSKQVITKNSLQKMALKKKNLTKTCGQGNVRPGKCPSGEMSSRELSVRGIVRSGKCPFGEMSVGEVSVGKVSVGELSAYPSGRMLLKTKNIYIVRINEECRTFRIKNWSKSWGKIEAKAFWLNLLFLKQNWTLDCLLCYCDIFLKIAIS